MWTVYFLVPTLDDNEILLLSREHVLSGYNFDSKRTSTLKKSNPRKYLFVKLLRTISISPSFKCLVNALTGGGTVEQLDDDGDKTGGAPPDTTPIDESESKKKGKGNGFDRQAKALKELQINGCFAVNKGPTTSSSSYNFRGAPPGASGVGLSNSASTSNSSKKTEPANSKTPKKTVLKTKTKTPAKKATKKAAASKAVKPKSVPAPVIDLDDADEEEEEEEKPSYGRRASRSGKPVTILPSSNGHTKILEEMNQATEAARRELQDLRREKAILERERMDFKLEQQNKLKKRASKKINNRYY